MKIVADRDIPFLEGVLDPFVEVVRLPGEAIGPDDVRDADAILTRTRTRCDAALLAGSRVRFIGTATIGFDHIDTEWCRVRGIAVATAAGCNRRGVLQWVGAVLAWLADGRAAGHGGRTRGPKPGGTTLGVVGVGNVGSLVADYAAAWGFRVMRSDPPRERAGGRGAAEGFYPLGEMVAACDIITFHVPLTAEGPDATRHMVNRDLLAAAKPGAVILNSSRGPVVEPDALRKEVHGGAHSFVIDTWNGEPAIDREVLKRTLLATPHIAGYTVQGKAAATSMVVRALAREFGLPLTEWYPAGAPRSVPRPIEWDEMRGLMPSYFDIAAESAALKAAPALFEAIRDGYDYRMEFF
ncbi:MAG: 4-phosphoerythronate dehydrogenase [Alistipes sp.]|nr:4-phosphoerythronate dehydrogenase [Alistipes sp.]